MKGERHARNEGHNGRPQKPNARLYRMKDLVQETGIPRETIHFYLSEGLLPEPVRKSRNMAWYKEEHIARLRQIKELQEKHFLPLKAIKAIVCDIRGIDFTPAQEKVIASLKRRYAPKPGGEGASSPSLSELTERFEIPPEEVEALETLGIITVDRSASPPRVAEEDLEIAEILAKLSEVVGFSHDEGENAFALDLEDLEIYVRTSALLFAQELEILRERMAEIQEEEAVLLFEKVMPLLNELFGLLHKKQVRRFLAKFEG
ncbi:MAG: MerR family transcriptional regulator [Deltaproteobacteria bacterium]|nr:MAG: MerR family transcriptional regulator [Deltaproteobacteria bacterium]